MSGRKLKEKTRNDGEWTESRFHTFIKSLLRQGSRKWPPKYRTLERACVGRKVNKATGRLAKHYTCAGCLGEFPASAVQVDHIIPVVDPELGFTTWDDIIERMFCDSCNLQVLCKDCHDIKTAKEREVRTHGKS